MKTFIVALFMVLSANLFASDFYTKVVHDSFDNYYPKLQKSIKDNHMNVLYELKLIEQFKKKGYAKKFGKDFNKNDIDEVVTLLICNGYVGNQVSNIDPAMMALCPIKLTIIKQGRKLTVTFLRHDSVKANPKVKELLTTLDKILIHTIDLVDDEYMQGAAQDSYESIHEGN